MHIRHDGLTNKCTPTQIEVDQDPALGHHNPSLRRSSPPKPATTVTKVCLILTQFKGQPTLGITEIARRTGLLPSDVHRLLGSLRSYGYVQQDDETKRYGIGPELRSLGSRLPDGHSRRPSAPPSEAATASTPRS